MNTQDKKRIALRNQYMDETGQENLGNFTKYGDWLETEIVSEYVSYDTALIYGLYCANERVNNGTYMSLHEFIESDKIKEYE